MYDFRAPAGVLGDLDGDGTRDIDGGFTFICAGLYAFKSKGKNILLEFRGDDLPNNAYNLYKIYLMPIF